MSISKKTILTLLAATAVLIAAPSYSLGFDQEQQSESQQRPPGDDPIRELNLTPEQRERIRAIREQLQAERAAINQRLRETNRALEEALDADNPDESVVEQRLRDVAAAQAASMRMRVLSEVRIRRVLNPEQLAILRTLRQNARGFRRGRQQDNIFRRREGVDGQRGLPNQRNGLGPRFPRRGDPQPSPRP
ncbi:MAG TPA: Spy/CpxP family protein refolding chaperone [Pyrinomonadaceae bacterium]|nr:Spy/CpxP family protein refolding chaperone [Pyrinomonadaceae bacterium]